MSTYLNRHWRQEDTLILVGEDTNHGGESEVNVVREDTNHGGDEIATSPLEISVHDEFRKAIRNDVPNEIFGNL